MIRWSDRSPKRTPLCRLGRCLLRQAFGPGPQQDLFSYWCQSLKIPALQSSTSGRCAAWAVRIVQINPEATWSQEKETLEKVVLWISSSNACCVDGSGKAVFLVGLPAGPHRYGETVACFLS